jgi:hypothetical protein
MSGPKPDACACLRAEPIMTVRRLPHTQSQKFQKMLQVCDLQYVTIDPSTISIQNYWRHAWLAAREGIGKIRGD